MGMRRVYVALDQETINALVQLAKANRRHPKHEGALIITRYLREQGLLGRTPGTVTAGEGAESGVLLS